MSNELESGIADVAFGKDEVGADSAARPADWRTYLATGPLASAEFMDASMIWRHRSATLTDRNQPGLVGLEVEL